MVFFFLEDLIFSHYLYLLIGVDQLKEQLKEINVLDVNSKIILSHDLKKRDLNDWAIVMERNPDQKPS